MVEIYKRGNSPFWYYDMTDPTAKGGRRRLSTKRTNRADAKKVADMAARKVLDREQLGSLEEVTLAEGLSRYERASTKKADACNITNRIEKLLGRLKSQPGRFGLDPDMMFHDLALRHLNRLREARGAEGNAEQTINHELRTLSAAHHLLKSEGVRVSPVLSFPIVKVAGKLRWLTEEEEKRLLAELSPYKRFVGAKGKMAGVPMTMGELALKQRQDCYDLAVFLLDTGCRYSEVGSIPWSAIDNRGWHWVDIYRSKVGNSDLLTMTGRLREILQRRYKHRGNSAYVFQGYSDDGRDAPRGKSTRAIQRAINRAGLNTEDLVQRYGRATTHTFRDTFASRLVQAGVSLFKVQRLLGHSSPQMTMKYAKLEPRGVADEAAAVLDRLRAEPSSGHLRPTSAAAD